MSGAVLLFGGLQNSGTALGAAGKTETHNRYHLIVWRKRIHWGEIEPMGNSNAVRQIG
jgi:hypothetical protein